MSTNPQDEMFETADVAADFDIAADLPDIPTAPTAPQQVTLTKQPLFQLLFQAAIPAEDRVLQDFTQQVVGPLSEHFALQAAKGGAFFQQKQAQGAENTERYQRDQTLRAHLVNGMLPARHIAQRLHEWGAPRLRYAWDETTERLFIAGYMLHDFTKIEATKQTLLNAGFAEGEAPSLRQIPTLETIFRTWCANLGLDQFLAPVGGVEALLHDIIYVACNTQQLWGTAQADSLLPRKATDTEVFSLATFVSRLADLLAYVAPTPREVAAHDSIRKIIEIHLGQHERLPKQRVARLVYHHVAENRGILLNLMHNAVLEALQGDHGLRVPLLYAPSGVVYLERHDAPDLPDFDTLTAQIVTQIRDTAKDRLIRTGKGAKRGNTSLQVDDSYNDFFDVHAMVLSTHQLVARYIGNNKAPNRLETLIAKGGVDAIGIAPYPTDPKDARVDKIAEWAAFIDKQYKERLAMNIAPQLLAALGIEDLTNEFEQMKLNVSGSGGVPLWWFWAATHALARHSGLDDTAVVEWLAEIAQTLAQELPAELPQKAQVNQSTWEDLTHYVRQVLTMGGAKSFTPALTNELARYTRAKSGKVVCALCGSGYTTRKPAETAISFQPGVYTARIKVGASDNKRSMCSLCALEQLLRQLFMENLDTGSSAESQRIRYLSFYPSYFFTPETLKLVQQAYHAIEAVRLSDKSLWTVLRETNDWFAFTEQHGLLVTRFWQGLREFLLSTTPKDVKFQRVLRYSQEAQATFLTVGFRNIDPTDTESWILPTWLALVLSVCLDVKVIASDSGIPLLVEASELPETVWLDGAHAAIQAVVCESRINIDQLGKALARLTAAYLIHLDTEYDPPKENWHRFGHIAHALMESPLYVFYFLKQQERNDKLIGIDQVRRYIRYAETLFNDQGDVQMSHAKDLVEFYRGFYRAKTLKNANSILRPLSVVADALLIADHKLFSDETALIEVAYGELYRFMDRVGKGLADGRFPKGVSVPEREQAMRRFCAKFVRDIFIGVFNQDVAALRGKQLNLLRSACEALYRDAQYAEWAARGKDEDETDDETDEA